MIERNEAFNKEIVEKFTEDSHQHIDEDGHTVVGFNVSEIDTLAKADAKQQIIMNLIQVCIQALQMGIVAKRMGISYF